MRFNMPLLRRFFGKLVHDILPAALASLLGGFLITHFQLNRVPEPVTVPVARASPEMMQLLRDEHGLIVELRQGASGQRKERQRQERKRKEAIWLPIRERAVAGRVAGDARRRQPLPAAPRPTMIVALPRQSRPRTARQSPGRRRIAAAACGRADAAERKRAAASGCA